MFSPLVSHRLLGLLACLLLLLEVAPSSVWSSGPSPVAGVSGHSQVSSYQNRCPSPHVSWDSPGSRWSGVGLPIKTGYSLRTGIFPTVAFSTQYASPC